MTYVTIYVDKDTAIQIANDYQCRDIRTKDKPYEVFVGDKNECNIKGYIDKKGDFSIVFSSHDDRSIKEAEKYKDKYRKWYKLSRTDLNHLREKDPNSSWTNVDDQIGSDEVGVGDFFGPLIVCATRTSYSDLPLLKQLKVTDSKKLSDQYIREIAPKLKENLPHFVICLSPEKLTALVKQGSNPHKVLALAHNQVHLGIQQKYNISDLIPTFVDAFTSIKVYKQYLHDELYAKDLTFKIQGELCYPSVAAASIIARYTFLCKWDEMEKQLDMQIPKGANEIVDKAYAELINRYSEAVVDKYVKQFFANYYKLPKRKKENSDINEGDDNER